jgi:hypothetical protein
MGRAHKLPSGADLGAKAEKGSGVNEIPIVGVEGREARELLAQYDAPAYVRRARRVQDAYDQLLASCRRQREQWLEMVRLRLGLLRARAGTWEALAAVLPQSQIEQLRDWHDRLSPRLRAPVEATSSARALRRTLVELRESIERFNRRWAAFLATIDLGGVNEARLGYNRYYLLEKECAVRSPAVARQGFRPLEPVTLEEVADLLPLLPVPAVP